MAKYTGPVIHVYLDEALLEAVRKASGEDGLSASSWVRTLIAKEIRTRTRTEESTEPPAPDAEEARP